MMRQSEFKMKLDPELGRYTRQHIYGEGMIDFLNQLVKKYLERQSNQMLKKELKKR